MSRSQNGARPQTIGQHAVVIGASVAGLLAARALSDAYQRVTILERDELPAVGEHRKAVPQGRHAHVLLGADSVSIEELLPGITDELLCAGVRRCESMREIRLSCPATRSRRTPRVLMCCSRVGR